MRDDETAVSRLEFRNGGNVTAFPILELAELFGGWASGAREPGKVYLPRMQRSAVWKPKQVLELWDSLLRGFPIGTFYLVEPEEGLEGFELLDGQQRMRAVLLGLPHDERSPQERCLWVDLGVKDATDLPKLYLTSRAQPFGYDSNGAKLPVRSRREARQKLAGVEKGEEAFGALVHASPNREGQVAYDLDLFSEDVRLKDGCDLIAKPPAPFGAERPVMLRPLLQGWRKRDTNGGLLALQAALPPTSTPRDQGVIAALVALDRAFERLEKAQVALLRVDAGLSGDERLTLFRRIGENGTPLGVDERFYSICKQCVPGLREAVERIHADAGNLLPPTALVMTALHVASLHAYGKAGTPDVSRLAAIMRADAPENDKAAIENSRFRSELNALILGSGSGRPLLEQAFANLVPMMEYDDDLGEKRNFWLPDAVLAELPQELWRVLVFWATMPAAARDPVRASRKGLVQFALFWQLCVRHAEAASAKCLYYLRARQGEAGAELFPARELYLELVSNSAGDLAHRLAPLDYWGPDGLQTRNSQSHGNKPALPTDWRTDEARFKHDGREASIGRAWWEGSRKVLPWLQRDYVRKKLPGYRPLTDHEDDLPWDYDHLCPKGGPSGWWWPGGGGRNPYPDPISIDRYKMRDLAWTFADRIGNLRLVNASVNRADQDDPMTRKMREIFTSEGAEGGGKKWGILRDDIDLWRTASEARPRIPGSGDELAEWPLERRLAFQKAAERRAAYLFKQFYDDLEFEEWFEADCKTPPVAP